jgi:hypothetical protein
MVAPIARGTNDRDQNHGRNPFTVTPGTSARRPVHSIEEAHGRQFVFSREKMRRPAPPRISEERRLEHPPTPGEHE